jgi:16S rRNA (uracil1498-N3)-methyltransferase
MSDFRAFHRGSEGEPGEITLSPEESHHLIAVNRAKAGDVVVVFNGRGSEWSGEIVAAKKSAAVLRMRERLPVQVRAGDITLAQVLPKGPAMDAIVRKATEIGAARIVPLIGERSQVHLDDERSDRKIGKWETAALEAAKQCGNPFIPEIVPVETASHFIAAARDYDLKLIASLQPGAKSLRKAVADFRASHGRVPTKLLWLIGPEGDFSPAESALAHDSGFVPITLGPLVLRCETAAVYALSVLSYELSAAD